MVKKLRIFLISVLLALTSVTPVFAAEAGDVVMSVNPSEQELTLTPGKRKNSSITVYNNGKMAFDFEVSVSPYSTGSERYEPDFVSNTSYTKLSNWIAFPETHFHVEPNHAATVDFNVAVPEDVPASGQYAAIIVRITNTESDTSSVQMVSQIAALVYGHVRGGELREEGEMISNDLPAFILGGDFRITSTFKNQGNIDYRVRQNLEIVDFFTGQTVISPNSDSKSDTSLGATEWIILPDTTRVVSTTWYDAPQLGLFRVKQTLSYLGQEQTFEKVVFLCPIWLLVLVAILVGLLVAWLIMRIRDHKQETPQVF